MCPIEGQWNPLSMWSDCSKECGGGELTRSIAMSRVSHRRTVEPLEHVVGLFQGIRRRWVNKVNCYKLRTHLTDSGTPGARGQIVLRNAEEVSEKQLFVHLIGNKIERSSFSYFFANDGANKGCSRKSEDALQKIKVLGKKMTLSPRCLQEH